MVRFDHLYSINPQSAIRNPQSAIILTQSSVLPLSPQSSVTPFLVRSERGDRIEPRGPVCRIESEEYTDQSRH